MSVKPIWVRFFPSDFLGGCAIMPGRQRSIYGYLLILQADQGSIRMTAEQIADHLGSDLEDVRAVLDIKFDFNVDINGWQNRRMREEFERSATILGNKREGAEKARRKKGSEDLDLELDSEIKVDINAKPARKDWVPDATQLRLNAMFKRRTETKWSAAELKAYRLLDIDAEELAMVERLYGHEGTIPDKFQKRTSLATLLNNWSGEVDKAKAWEQSKQKGGRKSCL